MIAIIPACLAIAISVAVGQAAVPPNCVCPKPPSLPPGLPAGPGNPGAPGGPGGPGPILCTNGALNFTNPCDLVNAQVANKSLGYRPCPGGPLSGPGGPPPPGGFGGLPPRGPGGFRPPGGPGGPPPPSGPGGPPPPGGPGGKGGACFTDGHSESTFEGGKAYLDANKAVGILCPTVCPCKPECPWIPQPPPSGVPAASG